MASGAVEVTDLEDGLKHVDGKVHAQTFGLGIAYQAWLPRGLASVKECPAEKRILAYPGWLDNSGSWAPLAPFLARGGYCVVALDPPGCGRSDHRDASVWYHDFDEVALLPEMAELVGWGDAPLVLMAHSRGSNICATATGAFPQLVRAAVLVESGLGMAGCYISNRPEFGEERFGGFKSSVEMNRHNRGRSPRVFASLEEAIVHNANNPTFPKSREIAEAIVLRHTVRPEGAEHGEGALTFAHDTRTYGQVQSRFITPGVNLRFLKSIRAPVLQILASGAPNQALLANVPVEEAMEEYRKRFKPRDRDQIPEEVLRPHVLCMRARVAAVPDLTGVELKGKHHLHGDIPEECAAVILPWLADALRKSAGRRFALPKDPRLKSGDLDELESVTHILQRQTRRKAGTAPVGSSFSSSSSSLPPVKCQEARFQFPSLQLAGKVWGDLEHCKERVIAWCDARDNCASFDELASRFVAQRPEFCVVAVDPPGLGKSGPGMPSDMSFGVSEESVMLVEIAAELGWETFGVWGHGRGASVVLFAAGGFPELVSCVVLLDPATTSLPDSWAPAEMAYAYEERKAERDLALPVFDSLQQLQECLETDPLFPKSPHTARAIAERRAAPAEDGNAWLLTDDKRAFRVRRAGLEIPQESFTAALGTLTAPTLVLVPSESSRRKPTVQRRRLLEELSHIRSPMTIFHIKGASHVHSCDPLAQVLPSLSEWTQQIGHSSWRSLSKI